MRYIAFYRQFQNRRANFLHLGVGYILREIDDHDTCILCYEDCSDCCSMVTSDK